MATENKLQDLVHPTKDIVLDPYGLPGFLPSINIRVILPQSFI